MDKKIIILIMIAGMFLVGCSTDIDVPFEKFSLSALCFEQNTEFGRRGVVIQNEEDYRGKLHELCEDKVIPEVDFSKHTLLGISISSTGSNQFTKSLKINHAQKEATYSVSVPKSNTQANIMNNDLVIASKIPDDYTIELK